jgi:CRISPR-associated protein Csh2
MNNEFKKRVYGAIVVKAINANYNADFSGLPRRLKTDGSFYATDKSFKWLVRNYIKKNYENEKVLFTKQYDEKSNTMKLKESFEKLTNISIADDSKNIVTSKLIEHFIDVRLFGAVFSPEGTKDNNVSIHGPVQINHASDLYKKGRIYTDEILAPFTAIGSMSKATEVHYIHNFSINPENLFNDKNITKNKSILVGIKKDLGEENQKLEYLNEKENKNREDKENIKSFQINIKKLKDIIKNLENEISYMEKLNLLSENDLIILKNSFNNAATYYDSHSKAGVENELSIYVTLNENSNLVLPSFAQFIKFYKVNEKIDDEVCEKDTFDLTSLINFLVRYKTDIEKIDLYFTKELTDLIYNKEEMKDKIKEEDLYTIIKNEIKQ